MFADPLEQGAIQVIHREKAGSLRRERSQRNDERVAGLDQTRKVEIADLRPAFIPCAGLGKTVEQQPSLLSIGSRWRRRSPVRPG